MKLSDYIGSPDALTVPELAKAIGVNNPAQVRQWQYGYANRQPGPESCVAIERATGNQVMRWDLRPSDWWLIWPELIDRPGAPPIPEKSEGVNA